ncbi:PAS domain S-box protein [Telluria mixta]|uniref:histidine kinase n=1 Tax=Telluria mixta TaxID=34071 RepID=A0ABT2C3H0_9BURK|nr:PAS domain S-box protein [Telluria mixta]MCS0631189.1 PAS domain S-box protein [Telluria mixta]WEM95729.1 PAS domain S-box protein [Telluria mixta]
MKKLDAQTEHSSMTVTPDARSAPQSLRAALLWLLLASQLPLVLVASAFLWMEWGQQRTTVMDALRQRTQTLALAVGQELDVNLAIVETLAALPALESRNWAEFHAAAAAAIKPRAPSWITLQDPSGQQLINTNVPYGAALPRKVIEPPEVEWHGRLLPTSDPRMVDLAYAQRPLVSALVYGPVLKRPVLGTAIPVLGDGKRSYRLIVGFTPDTLIALLARERSADATTTAIIDGNGRLIARNRDGARFLGMRASPPFDRGAALGPEGMGDMISREGEPLVYAYRRIQPSDWTIVVAVPRHRVFAPVYRTFVPWLATTLLMAGVGLWLAHRLQRRLALPLIALAGSADALRRGEVPQIPGTRIRELDTLSRALQRAVRQEQAARDELTHRLASEEQAKVAAQTAAQTLSESEERFRALNANLELLVAERTARLEEKSRQLEQAAIALRVNEARLQGILENSPAVIYVQDPEGRYVHLNRQFAETYGLPRDELIGKTVFDFLPAHLALQIQQEDARILADGVPLQLERSFPIPGKGLRDFLLTRFAMRGDDGTIYGLGGIATDITELRHAEHELEAALTFLRAILESANYAIIATDTHGIIRTFNPAAEALLGYGAAEVIGKATPELFHGPGELAERAAILQREYGEPVGTGFDALIAVARRQGVEEGEYDLLRKDGRQVPVLVSITALRDAQGCITGYLGIVADISARRQADAAIAQLNRTLARRAAELEAVNRELESFSYSVSHDLRAPLRSIDGFSQVLLEDYAEQLDDEGRDSLRRVRAASQRMAQLIDDLLTLSRLSRTEIRRETVDLSAIARSIAGELRALEPQREVEFVIEEGVTAHGDARLLRAVLENLLGNAWKYTSRHARARIEFGSELRNDGRRVYYVRDDGAGFDMAYAGKLFGAFQRLHTAAEFPGTGVGLSIVQRIVHRHGGEVWAAAAPEAGAMFRFVLGEHSDTP